MVFGKFLQKDKDGKDLTLGDYKSIWTKFCFLDESGSLSNPKDPFFTVGFIKCSQPYYLQSKIIYERQKRNFHDEMHFNKLSKNNLEFCKFAIDAFFSTRSLSFSSYSLAATRKPRGLAPVMDSVRARCAVRYPSYGTPAGFASCLSA